MSDRNSHQPSGVTTQERPRPPDSSVVTSDIDLSAGAESPPKKPAEQQRDTKTPAAATDEQSARSNGQDSATDDDKTDPPPKRRNQPAEYRIKKMTRKLADSERSREALERRLAEQDQRLAKLEQQTAQGGDDDDPPPEPQLEDFKNPRQYAKAYAKWEKQVDESKTSRSNAPSRTAPRKDDPPPREQRPDVDREIRDFQSRGEKQYGDEFMEALQAQIPVSQDMGEYMLDSEHGPSLYIHLANNPEEARKIHDSSPMRAAKLLAALDARAAKGELDVPEGELRVDGDDDKDDGKDDTDADKSTSTPKGKTAGEKDPPRRGRQQTRVPDPPNQNNDRGKPVTDTDLEALDMEDYAATRREQLKNKRF